MTNQELYEKRASLIADARSILDAADAEGRELTSEQREQVDNMLDDSDAIKADVDQRIRLQKCGEMLEEVEARKSALAIAQPQKKEGARGIRSEEYSNAFWQYLRDGELSLTPEQRAVMVEGTNTVGGFAAPMFDFGQASLQDMIIETMDSAYNFQEYATRITIGGEINVPVQNAVGTAAWTAENVDATESETTFTQLKFQPHKATRIVQVSRELLADSYVDMASFMAGMFGRSFATLLNAAFIDGDGTAKPHGITDGTDKGADAASATVITWDELQTLFYSLKEPYRANGTWLFNSTTAAEIRGLKADGRYIWEPSGQLGQPDLLLGRPVAINDDCEDTATGLKPILFGDLSYYWITWREGMDFQRLDELYAVAGNIGLRSELRVDGQLTSSEAVKHMLMA
mgnify:CR=1 FL=1